MQHGDFTKLAKNYVYRPAYDPVMLKYLLKIIDYEKKKDNFKVVEVGAGTGKLTKMLLELGLNVVAVEPNDAMREEGIKYTKNFKNIKWIKGSGEKTNIDTHYADWVVMASSFHWTDYKKSLPEFHRILKENGYFTAMWNPRNIKLSDFHSNIEKEIKKIIPELKRVSSGAKGQTKEWEYIIISTGHFKECIFMETDYEEIMTKERYLKIWESVNDIRVQAGEERWQKIMDMIKQKVTNMTYIKTPYKIRAWTAKKV